MLAFLFQSFILICQLKIKIGDGYMLFSMTSLDDNNQVLDYDEELDAESSPRYFWTPVCDNNEPLDSELLRILKTENKLNKYLCSRDLDFLRALRAANIKDADKIIEAIEKFHWIEIQIR